MNDTPAFEPSNSAWPATNTPRFLSKQALEEMMSVERAADALAEGFIARDPALVEGFARTALPLPDPSSDPSSGSGSGSGREMLLMPATGPEGAGLKLVTVVRDNPGRSLPLIQGLYVLMSREGLTPELVIDGGALTKLRTAAVSVLATRRLARADSRHLVVFGAGTQALAHVEAMRRVRPIERVTIVGRRPAAPSAAALADRLRAAGVDAAVGEAAAIRDADLVCTCTTSSEPVFDDQDVPAGVHINAIGAYRPDMRELPADTLARALLVVESVEATLAEAGDVLAAIERAALPGTGFASDLCSLVRGEVARADERQVTVFKSVGLAVEDLIVARAIADVLSDTDTGTAPAEHGQAR
ncbi:ornithine cyclodeaminase family protein [Conexibacter sp. S30A1]|jgi:ornithine cyclodeaminase|uniref:ornithine cyclodeaminase family protein n=1 Tax=Conexibacter sp. S30A1 TaxID=2937800 RepID=UPI00200CC428|nr:ornithine cyclodeaminase family protein [Conexibacter sp. S30A1]